jgi:hypothetical protein
MEHVADGSIERREGLVEEKGSGIGGKSPRDGDALLLPTRELVRIVVGVGTETDAAQQLPGTFPRGRAHRKLYILAGRQMGKERVLLEDQSDLPLARRQVDGTLSSSASEEWPAIQRDLSLSGSCQAGNGRECLGFAGARWAKEDEDLAADRQVDIQPE